MLKSKNNLVVALLIIVMLVGLSYAGYSYTIRGGGFSTFVTLVEPSPPVGYHTLQLRALEPIDTQPVTLPTLPVSVPSQLPVHSPPPGNCVADGQGSSCSQCCGGTCDNCGAYGKCHSGLKNWCDAKPVIDLYPTKDTDVSVKITLPGVIAESIPTYPVATGWQHILAHPDGRLDYQGKTYTELFYETAITPIVPPQTGLVVQKSHVKETLLALITQLGLQPKEQQEFMQYWMQRLDSVITPYFFISIFSPKEKKAIDQVDITPSPDTFIQFNLYFKPLKTNITVAPFVLPSVPLRHGFVAVEWGGVLVDTN